MSNENIIIETSDLNGFNAMYRKEPVGVQGCPMGRGETVELAIADLHRRARIGMPAHIKAIDWALSQGYVMSVTDLQADDGEWDLERSSDREAIIEACRATDIPNVYIFRTKPEPGYLLTFSVIDEGVPDETVNDWTVPRDDAEQWRIDGEKAFELAVLS